MIIETKNLKIIACDDEILQAAIDGNDVLASKINAIVEDDWTEFGELAFQYALNKLKVGEDEKYWWTYFPIHKQDNKLIGSAGYKGKPTIEGVIELGYEIRSNYRNRGLATELVIGLIDNALKDTKVKSIIAHTLGHHNASTSVLKKCRFEKVDEMDDSEHGIIWKWKLNLENREEV